jgi:hypothetical protein
MEKERGKRRLYQKIRAKDVVNELWSLIMQVLSHRLPDIFKVHFRPVYEYISK